MNFELSEEQLLLRDQSRRFLADACPSDVVRRVLDTDDNYAEVLWGRIAEMGWTATVIPEEYEGLGLSSLELVVIAEELGRVCAPVPFSSSVYLATEMLMLAGSPDQKAEWLPRLASGEVTGTLAYSEGGGQPSESVLKTQAQNGRVSGFKSAVPDAQIADFVIVLAAGSDEGSTLYLVDLNDADVLVDPVNSLDPTRCFGHVQLNDVEAQRIGSPGEGWSLLQKLLDRAAVLFAWEQLGGAEACLEMARGYALERFAFGRSVASYQLVKKMLVDMYVKNTLARSNAYFAAWAMANNTDDLPLAAATARVAASNAYAYAAKENIQIHGGMGYTWEFDCQFHYRRSKVLSVAIGSETIWHEKLIKATDLKQVA